MTGGTTDGAPAGGGAIEKRLRELGLVLPRVPDPIGNFELGAIHGDLLFLSGQGPLLEDGSLARGKVGDDIDMSTAQRHARQVGLVLISAMRTVLGDLDRVSRIVKLLGMVNAHPAFDAHSRVIDGCSDLMCQVFGPRGAHSRSAVGVGSLPGGISIEIEAVVGITNAGSRR